MDVITPDPSEHFTGPCSNEVCNCEVSSMVGGEGYCSDSCREAADSEEQQMCACAHSPCDVP